MAIKPEAAATGMTLYSRARTKMGNTTIRTLSEWTVHVVEGYDPVKGYAVCSWNGNRETRYYPRQLKALYDWNMWDKDAAEMVRGICSPVAKVTRRKKCATCKKRHASAECPEEET